MSEIYIVTSLFATQQDALSVASQLIEKRLAACVNVSEGIISVYRLEGKVRQEQEAQLSAKTTKERCQAVLDEVKRLHPYELPCIMAYPVGKGYPPFFEWVKEETAG